MDLRHLKMIDEVARCRSLTKAAENLYISQSALSHQLKEAESFYKTQLFTRHNKQMILTRAGELVLESSRKVINEIETTSKRIQQITEKDAGEIRVSTQCFTGYPWLASFMKEFSQLYPKVQVKIVTEATRKVIPYLLDNKLDVGIFEEAGANGVEYIPLFNDELVFIVSADHKYGNLKKIDPDKMRNEAYVMYNIPCEQSAFYKIVFKDSPPRQLYTMELSEAIIGMVKAGLGFAILPNWLVNAYVQAGDVKAIRIGNGMKRTWCAGIVKHVQHPPYVKAFISRLGKHMKFHGKAGP